jgi:lysozyme family protein
MAPLSGKQQREYLKFQNKEAREAVKMELDEGRKQQLHEIKLQEAAAKANQGLGHKEQVNNAKLKDMGIPPAKMNKQKLGIPTQNPLAGTGMFKQGQRSLAQAPIFQAQGTDTVPAMLTPGEAVIPAPAAQNPKNKKAIKRMVQEGRKANRLRDGAVDVRYSDAPGQAKYHMDGTSGVPSLAYRHPDVPGSSFNDGTMSVPDFSRGSSAQANYNNGTYGVVPQQVQQAVGYNNGNENVSYMDRFLNFIGGQKIPEQQPVVAPLAAPASDFNTVIEKVFQREYPSEDKAYHVVKGDKGGPTKYGISQRAYPNLDIKNLTKEQAIEIAKRDYWDKNKIDELDPALREIHFDTAFNKGNSAAKTLLKRSGGDPTKYLDERQKYANEIVKSDPSQKKFQKGWSNRVGDLRKVAETATDVLIPSAQAGTLPTAEVPSASATKAPVPPLSNIPTGREVLIAKQDLATSTNPRVIQAAKDVLAKANQAIPTLADTRAPIFDVTNGVTKPVNLFNQDQKDLIRLSEIINDPSITANDKKWAYTEIDRIKRNNPLEVPTASSVPTVVSDTDTNKEIPKPVNVLDNQQAMANDREFNTSLSTTSEIPTLEGNGLKPGDKDRFNMLGLESKKELDRVSEEVKRVTQMQGTPEEKQGFLAKALEGIFGPKGLFSDKELIRFGILAAGGMLTGGSVGGSLRVAGLNTLQAADRRQSEEASAAKQQAQIDAYNARQDKQLTATAAANARKDQQSLYNNLIKSAQDIGQISPEVSAQLYRASFAGKFGDIESVLNTDKFATPQYRAGLKPTDKPSTFIQEGFTTHNEMYRDPKDPNLLISISRGPDGKSVISRVPAKGYREVTSTADTVAEKERQFKDTNLSARLFGVDDKKNKGIYFDLSKQDAVGQLKTWQNQQRKLNLPDDYTQFSEQINHALDIAAKTGERKPHVGKMLDMLVINSTALTNNDIIIDSTTKKMIEPGKLGKLTEDVNLFNEKKLGKEADKKKVLAASNAFINKVSEGYNAPGDKLSQLQLAEKVGRDNPMFNKIKEAPNPYWGYVYYQMAIDKPKKE